MIKQLAQKLPSHLIIAASGWFSRIIIAIVQLVSIPVFYHKLGLRDFAVFTVITSLNAWYNLADLGLGSTLQNYISEYRAQNKNPATLLTAIFPIICLLLLSMLLLFIICGTALKEWLFSNLPNTLSTFHFVVCLSLYTGYYVLLISNKIFFAYQKGFYGYFYQNIAYFILLIAILIINYCHLGVSLNMALYIWIVPLFISGLISLLHVFKQAGASIQIKHWDTSFLKQLHSRAFQFWIFSVSANGVLAIDYIVIVKLLSDQDIVAYNIINKIFIMVLFAYSAVLSALWPVLAEKYAKGERSDLQFAERELKRSLYGGIAYAILATITVLCFRNFIVQLFRVEQIIVLPVVLLVIFGIYTCIRIWTDTYAIALQARSQMKIILLQTPIQGIIAIGAMIFMAPYGLIGIMLALIISFVTVPAWILPWYHYRNLRERYARA